MRLVSNAGPLVTRVGDLHTDSGVPTAIVTVLSALITSCCPCLSLVWHFLFVLVIWKVAALPSRIEIEYLVLDNEGKFRAIEDDF